ncbi:MerR family transcriptional regulator [Eubacterium sp. 1001713B170207_170306_E7]|uniref:MerR family transcriptional regulator n=1 Tax=Eubacterium sp. 1001713B170207_170306_E7 TaxID=2787097 RepID=UPI00189A1C97|nr:MerR family transcriptional regulator [Eubacterium sp. 1001713B170207_170306_E7]
MNTYTIKEVSEKTGLSIYTLRYYDKEGLLPFVERSETGIRQFTDADLEWLSTICCLKDTGMPLKEIKEYIDLFLEGTSTLETRRQIFIDHRVRLLKKIEELEKNLEMVEHRIQFYDEACAIYEARSRENEADRKERVGSSAAENAKK